MQQCDHLGGIHEYNIDRYGACAACRLVVHSQAAIEKNCRSKTQTSRTDEQEVLSRRVDKIRFTCLHGRQNDARPTISIW